MTEENYFKKALSNFVNDEAYVLAIKHMVDVGLSLNQMKQKLAYPVSLEVIERVATDYLFESGMLSYQDLSNEGSVTKEEYIRDIGKFGRVSFRKVVKTETSSVRYIPCDAWIYKDKNPDKFTEELSKLPEEKRELFGALNLERRRVYVQEK